MTMMPTVTNNTTRLDELGDRLSPFAAATAAPL
ncbi:Uncharacterised protein [Mycobacterium tuberculosis]|uniref:Uncharacterized protein n=1 Tax=Mycobacterium tuberculosis TaxID=1773 RepID=A0A0T9DR44_MYCTX|nr:Uncharacterised protein [Mycobacterium tuberculosis]CFR90682.1 Uncharacterised protein [Mycobacterium tuberculosis]CFS08554.1 Uncharacterised protein [Mycobacterium tuberculosis]CFS09251.1 Uncharacterised protein [Mycobacterium tuberculosis]CFS18306.1 Uncharacterised protein [Mycobacterium tuberculosis]